MTRLQRLRHYLFELYEGPSEEAARFRYLLLGFDLITILFLIVSTFFRGIWIVEWLDVLFGLYVLADYLARLWISDHKIKFTLHILNVADLLALISFLAPLAGENLGFLRSLRMLRFLRSLRLLERLRRDFPYFQKNEDIILRSTHLLLFIFMMTEIVYVTQFGHNDHIRNFIDAMYFTVTTLTTTGFGDITLGGTSGRFISVVIMLFGVSLFLRLMKSILRPQKIRFVCTDCGLFLHENDAVHCKHCGKTLNIPSDGDA